MPSKNQSPIALATDNQSRYDVFIKRKILPQNDGKIYIPFESGKDYGNLKIYSQWNKTAKELLIVYENIRTLFTVGESFCTVDGTKRPLDEPLSLCDGLPMLDLNFLCEILGLSLSVDEKRIQVHGN